MPMAVLSCCTWVRMLDIVFDIVVRLVFESICSDSVAYCTISVVNWFGSVGLSGSCDFSCVASSDRN